MKAIVGRNMTINVIVPIIIEQMPIIVRNKTTMQS